MNRFPAGIVLKDFSKRATLPAEDGVLPGLELSTWLRQGNWSAWLLLHAGHTVITEDNLRPDSDCKVKGTGKVETHSVLSPEYLRIL